MPELPEVETIAREIRARLRGARIASFRVLRPDYVRFAGTRRFRGRRIARVRRHGKRLHVELAPDGELIFHLGMSGQLTVCGPGAPVAAHTHLRIGFERPDCELRVRDPRRFGGVWVRGAEEAHWPADSRAPGALGEDALAIDLPRFRELCSRERQIKALLLDQRSIAGVGNIYCDEALFAARIHPLTPASGLRDEAVSALWKSLRSVLRSAIRHRGSTLRDYRTADGSPGGFQARHRVYGRSGKPCPECGSPIVRLLVASRSTHLCPACQRKPRRRGKVRARRKTTTGRKTTIG